MGKYKLFLKYGRLNTFGIAAFSETLGTAIIYQRFPCILRKCYFFNDTHRENSIQYNNGCLAPSDLFHMFTQSIKFYKFHCYVLKSTDV